MSVALADLVSKVRYLIEDNLETGIDPFSYEESSVFSITESNATAVLDVALNSISLDSGTYEYSPTTNKLTLLFDSGINLGDTLEITYEFYPNYSDSVIKKYIQSALIHISINNLKDFILEEEVIYPEPSDREKNLICMIASLLINPDNKSYNLPEIRVSVPKDLPTNEKISKTIALFKKDNGGIFTVV